MNNAVFHFLQESSLQQDDFNENINFLFDGVLAERLITLFYADGGNGKSWLAFALAKHCVAKGLKTVYCDFDNPLSVLKERQIDQNLIHAHASLNYIQRSKCKHSPQEILDMFDAQAMGDNFKGWVIFIDSLRNFCNVGNEHQSMDTMDKLMNMREAGATIVILHHSNKDGKNYQGSNNIRNSIDNMYQVSKIDSDDGAIRLHLRVQKERANIHDTALEINTRTLSMHEIDAEAALLSPDQKSFISTICSTLKQGDANKTQLLSDAGKAKDDKTARAWLDEFDGKYWASEKISGVFTYRLLSTTLQP